MPQRHLATPGGNADMAAMAQAMQHEMEMETPETVEEYMAHEKEHADAFASQIRKGGAALHISQTIEEDEEAERQLEANLWKYYRLLHPKGKFKPRWDSFVQILVVYNCTIIPMKHKVYSHRHVQLRAPCRAPGKLIKILGRLRR